MTPLPSFTDASSSLYACVCVFVCLHAGIELEADRAEELLKPQLEKYPNVSLLQKLVVLRHFFACVFVYLCMCIFVPVWPTSPASPLLHPLPSPSLLPSFLPCSIHLMCSPQPFLPHLIASNYKQHCLYTHLKPAYFTENYALIS